MSTADDEIFWERIIDMPPWEAEQELVLRREKVVAEIGAMLNEMAAAKAAGNLKRAGVLAIQQHAHAAQLTKVNERIKYLRKLQNRVQWKEAVLALYGQEAYERCVVWIEQQYGHIEDQRRVWEVREPQDKQRSKA